MYIIRLATILAVIVTMVQRYFDMHEFLSVRSAVQNPGGQWTRRMFSELVVEFIDASDDDRAYQTVIGSRAGKVRMLKLMDKSFL